MAKYIGIDPGSSSGHIVAISENGIECFSIGKGTLYDLYAFLRAQNDAYEAVLEKVHGMPGMSVKAVSSFMKSVGHIEAMLTANSISWKEVTPGTWMKHFNMKKDNNETKTAWKNRLRDVAERRFPEQKITVTSADAYLIALYAKEINN